jgi:phosphatidylglycerophosphate synthase
MSHDTWFHRLARVTVVKPLANTPVTPNHLTMVRLAAGLGAAGSLAAGETDWAAGLFVLSMLMDRADGDLARLTGKTSPFGHKLDLITDALCNTLIFVGLGIGLSGGAYGAWAIPMGLLAGGAVALILFLVLRIEALEGARAAEIGNFHGIDPDDAIVAVPIALWLGWAEGLLVAASIGAPAFAIFFVWLFRRKLKAAA